MDAGKARILSIKYRHVSIEFTINASFHVAEDAQIVPVAYYNANV